MLAKRFAKTKLVAIILIALFATNILAQPLNTLTENVESEISGAAIKNLAAGIESDNAGVKKCCIYFAGFYEIKELVNPLVKQLKKESNEDMRILIVFALYKIGDQQGIEAVQQLVKYDGSTVLKKMNLALKNELRINNTEISEN